MHGVRKRTCGRLCPGIDPMTNRPALHEDDRMVAVLARDGRGQARDESRLCPADDLLEALRGQVMAFVDDQMAIVSHQVTHHVLSHEALDDRDVQRSRRLLSPAADSADGFGGRPRNADRRSTHWSSNCRRCTRTSVLTPRWAISHAATTVFPKAVVADKNAGVVGQHRGRRSLARGATRPEISRPEACRHCVRRGSPRRRFKSDSSSRTSSRQPRGSPMCCA